MPFLNKNERLFLQAVSHLAYANPFLPERIEREREALGSDFQPGEPVWSLRVESPNEPHANTWRVAERAERMLDELREKRDQAARAPEADLVLYEDAALFVLFHRYTEQFWNLTVEAEKQGKFENLGSVYSRFLRDWRHYWEAPGVPLPSSHEPAHTFACFFQIQRAFYYIFTCIVGNSMAAARLRAAVWQSIFTRDMRRYRRTMYARMGDFATLITGPSGTGKELVARAIAMSRYLAFDDAKMRFEGQPGDSFHAVNLAALSPTLIESELFGHRRGAFTGAVQDRKGWLEVCPSYGTVFLDEIGELDVAIQVKLLRVIETRTFQAVGDTTNRRFKGKLVAATNRDLARAIRDGQFREDLFYRLCSDQIVTPSLREQLDESPRVLRELVLFVARRVAGEEAEELAREVESWVLENLGRSYPWPGNYRELEQCSRNVLIRKQYHPPQAQRREAADDLASAISKGELTADELVCRYASIVYRQTGSYQETARRLQLDRRTVKAKIASQGREAKPAITTG